MYFREDQVADLEQGLRETKQKTRDIMMTFTGRQFRTDKGREYAQHGFIRRVMTLDRCVSNVFELIPLACDEIPSGEARKDAEISIQAFVFNVFGALDNLAAIWVEESALTHPSGRALRLTEVGLGKKFRIVRKSFSTEFQVHLATFNAWYEHIEGFRHALAHRIPLYIPPYCVDPDNEKRYRELNRQETIATLQQNFERVREIEQERMELAHFKPFMTHSVTEAEGIAVFHPQLLADYATVYEVYEWMTRELDGL